MLDIDNQTDTDIPTDSLKSIVEKVLLSENREVKDISLLLLDKGRSRSYNKKFRGKDSETDVISFASELAFLPTYGEIIIDLSVAAKQRGERSLDEEVKVLFLHGLLHLLGFDHLSARGRIIMEQKEKEYYNLIVKEKL